MNCKYCFVEIQHYAGTGRIPEYCCNACRQAMYRFRSNGFVRHRRSKAAMNTVVMLSIRNSAGERSNSLPLLNTTGAGRPGPDNTPTGYKQMDFF